MYFLRVIGLSFILILSGCTTNPDAQTIETPLSKTHSILFCEHLPPFDGLLKSYARAELPPTALQTWREQLIQTKKQKLTFLMYSPTWVDLILLDENENPTAYVWLQFYESIGYIDFNVKKRCDSEYQTTHNYAEMFAFTSPDFTRSVYDYMWLHFPEKMEDLKNRFRGSKVTLENLIFGDGLDAW